MEPVQISLENVVLINLQKIKTAADIVLRDLGKAFCCEVYKKALIHELKKLSVYGYDIFNYNIPFSYKDLLENLELPNCDNLYSLENDILIEIRANCVTLDPQDNSKLFYFMKNENKKIGVIVLFPQRYCHSETQILYFMMHENELCILDLQTQTISRIE